jgi:hypothetical protein
MMKAILGSAIGGAVAGAVALVASAQGRPAAEPWPAPAQGAQASPYVATVATVPGLAASTTATATPTLVQCEPNQEAVLQRAIVGGRDVSQVTCVSRLPMAAVATETGYARPVSYQPDIVQRSAPQRIAPRTVRRSSPVQRETAPKRSWKKTALVIGGSAGAGAGVGAIAGGKKGALIGAAIGGGAASIYEAVKRR